ncbi:MAG TPA: hypothetical protein VNM90_05735, partial [Haliangium sp.]|nr:hypothetical protein [Haliangium sp.]
AAVALVVVVCAGAGSNAPPERAGVPLVTRSGAPARGDEGLARSLLRLQVHASRGEASSPARTRILGPEVAEALGRDGRALIAYLLDYTSEIVSSRRTRRARELFFGVLAQLNARLDERGLGYYLCAAFRWDDDYKRVELVDFEPFAITGTRTYLAQGSPVRVLHLQRLGASWLYASKLGFSAPEYPEVFAFPRAIAAHVRDGLLPAADPAADTPLFAAVEAARGASYLAFRRRLADVMHQELGIGVPGMRRERAAAAVRDALSTAVELHEIQHLLDHRRKPSLTGRFDQLASRLGDEHLARETMYEVSAHLAQLARDSRTARTILGELLSNAFTDVCSDADCLATLVLLEEIGAELGHAALGSLSQGRSYEIQDIAELYVAIARHETAAVSGAARAAWERLFATSLPDVQAAR